MLPVPAHPWNKGRKGWFVRWTDTHGQRRSKRVGPPGLEGEAIASDYAARINAQLAREALLGGKSWGLLTVEAAVLAWRDRYAPLRSRRTQITDQAHVDRLVAYFGSESLTDLTDDACHGFAASIVRTGRSGHVAAGALSILRRVVNIAAKTGAIERAPAIEWGTILRTVRGLSGVSNRDAWSVDETAQILALARDYAPGLAAPLAMAFHTGARRGELLALRWEDVDLPGRRIHFRRTAAAGGGTKRPKAGRGRLMPISETLAGVLEAHREAQRRGALRGREMPEWVFPSPRGKPWAERNFSRTWQRLRTRFAKDRVRPLPFHCSRHTFITRALEANVPVTVVAGWVGASPSVIQTHYAHVIPSSWSVGFLDQERDRFWSPDGPQTRNFGA